MSDTRITAGISKQAKLSEPPSHEEIELFVRELGMFDNVQSGVRFALNGFIYNRILVVLGAENPVTAPVSEVAA